jgi:hypothetical protein
MKNSNASYTPTSHRSIFISFCFSTVHLTVFLLLMRKLLITHHSSHNPVICSSHTAMTCSHQKISSWIQHICRMKLVYYSPVKKKMINLKPMLRATTPHSFKICMESEKHQTLVLHTLFETQYSLF